MDIKKLRELCEISKKRAEQIIKIANALPRALDEIERLRKENQEMVREGLAADVEIVKENMRLIEEVERLRKENERLSLIATIAGEGLAEAVRRGE